MRSSPPLEYVGTGAPDRPNGQDGIRLSNNKADSDDDMPPLEYVGSTESNPGPASTILMMTGLPSNTLAQMHSLVLVPRR